MHDAKERYKRIRKYFSQRVSEINQLFPDITTEFENIPNDNENKIARINQITLGAIVAVLAYGQTVHANIHPVNILGQHNLLSPYLKDIKRPAPKFDILMSACRDPDIIKAGTTEDSELLLIPHYKLRWNDLCYKAGLISGNSYLFNISTKNISSIEIENIGKQVINGSLPFDILILEEAFPEIQKELSYLATLINPNSESAQYCQIKRIFHQAKKASKNNQTSNGENFRQSLESLRMMTLNNFLAGTFKYNAEGSLHIEKQALCLAEKVGSLIINQQDITSFKRNTKDYIQHTWSCILAHLLGGMLLGIVPGFIVGGILSGIFAIPAGIFIGIALSSAIIGAASLTYTMLGIEHPIKRMAKTLSASLPLDSEKKALSQFTNLRGQSLVQSSEKIDETPTYFQ